MKKIICVIGGDKRNDELINILRDKGYVVKVYDGRVNLREFLSDSTCVVSGIPFSRDNETINAPNLSEKVDIEELFMSMGEGKILIAGSFSDKIKSLAQRYKIRLYDFLDDEDFAVYNAIPTAEGAIEIAMRKTEKTINSSNCLVLGYGRIGKVLADLLKGLHADITVTARKDEHIAWIKAMGYKYKKYSELKESLKDFDIIFNTVPALIIKKEELENIRKDSLIIDLSSKPGGIDFEFAKEKGINAELALGLPGKVAPKSVAEYMANKVINVN